MNNHDYKSYDELPPMLTVLDVAGVLGINRVGAYELVKQPNFPTQKDGRRILIPKEQFFRWINAQTSMLE
ncbi:MAG: helix-turn-helix domain-containing protein [Deltaproteobacteria bacterium]|nr:helix-turn-helix domain-containing protein [Deltaproteobacteria bacterium]